MIKLSEQHNKLSSITPSQQTGGESFSTVDRLEACRDFKLSQFSGLMNLLRADELVLYDAQQIGFKIQQHVTALLEHSKNLSPNPLLVLGVCEGGFYYTKCLEAHPLIQDAIERGDIEFLFIKASRYTGQVGRAEMEVTGINPQIIAGRHTVLAEDMIDEGFTLVQVAENLMKHSAASVKIVTLVSRHEPAEVTPSLSILSAPFILKNDFPNSEPWIFGTGLDNGLKETIAEDRDSRYRAGYNVATGQFETVIASFRKVMHPADLGRNHRGPRSQYP